jgi:hypothetical protein
MDTLEDLLAFLAFLGVDTEAILTQLTCTAPFGATQDAARLAHWTLTVRACANALNTKTSVVDFCVDVCAPLHDPALFAPGARDIGTCTTDARLCGRVLDIGR